MSSASVNSVAYSSSIREIRASSLCAGMISEMLGLLEAALLSCVMPRLVDEGAPSR
jgi:hypothetical protein